MTTDNDITRISVDDMELTPGMTVRNVQYGGNKQWVDEYVLVVLDRRKNQWLGYDEDGDGDEDEEEMFGRVKRLWSSYNKYQWHVWKNEKWYNLSTGMLEDD